MFQHLKRRSDYSTKSYTVYGTPMEQKIQQAWKNKRERKEL